MATIKQYQEDPYKNYLQKTKMAESGGDNNAKAKTSSALGSFQFLEGTWKDVVNKYNLGYTLADRTDPEKAEKVMRLFTQDNEKALKPILGRNLTDGEKYLGHFLGIDGASNMFKASKKDPNIPVSYYISPKTIEANKSVFYNKDGSIKTTQQVYNWADKKMGGKVESYNTTQTTPTTPLTNFDIPTINRSFASVPDSPKEETKKEEKPSEALNQLKEEEFVKQYKSLFTQPQVVQQEQEVNQPIQTADLQGIFNQVSQFVDGDVAQQGGKKPIYVTDKNDPRYKAYNDSLNSFEKSESFKNDIIKYVGKNISKSQQEEMINLAMNYQREKYDYDKGWNRKIEPIDKTVIHLTKTFKNGAEGNIDLENYKKPQQPIILEETRPKVQGLNDSITPAGIKTQQELPQGEELQQRTYAQIPTSYNVSSQRYNMQGENPYYNFNAEKADYETALRAKLSAENYNADIERRYGNEEALKNPKAVERLNQLRQEVKITPNYQNGGEIVKDNNGYWNPNNWGKTVQIDGGDITMKGVTQILEGYSPETGERKLMFPNFDYKFKNATIVIEKELKPNEIEFLKNIKK